MGQHIDGAKRARTHGRLAARVVASLGLLVMLSGCGPWVGMPSVWGGTTKTIVDAPGSQATIDAGQVDNWSGCWPGQGCTVHIAAHRSSHGSTFAMVPSLKPGDPVNIGYGGTVYHYRVDSLQVAQRSTNTYETIVGDLVLQTSHPDPTLVYVVYATLVSTG